MESSRTEDPVPAGFLERHGKTLVGSLAVMGAFAFVLNRGALPLLPPADALAALRLGPALAFVFGMSVHAVSRVTRSYFLVRPLAPVSLRRISIINGIALVFITFLPFRLGEVYRPAMLRKQGSLSAWEIAGTVFAERVIDGALFSVLLFVGLSLAVPHEPIPTHLGSLPIPASLVPRVARFTSIAFGGAFLGLVVAYRFRVLARRVTESVLGVASPKLGKAVADIVERLANGLGFLRDPRCTVPYLAVTIGAAVAHVWAIEQLAEAVGVTELSWSQAMVVTGVLALGFALPNAPGFFGAVQLAFYAGLAIYIDPAKVVVEGAVMVFVFYLTFLGLILLCAAVSLVLQSLSPAED